MAGSLNKVILIGRLGRDPELRYTQSGVPVANLSLATDESYTDRDGRRQERTEWHRVVVWNKQGETVAKFLSKGRLVYVEGSLQTRKWQDQQGQERYTTEIKAQRVLFLDSTAQGETRGVQGQGQQAASPAPDPFASEPEQDLGPAFPSEASAMDDAPF